MRSIARITRILPLALLLTISVLSQALFMSHHDHASGHVHSGELQTIVICTDGEFREIAVDANGEPIEEGGSLPHCPLCLASGIYYLEAAVQLFLLAPGMAEEKLLPVASYSKPTSREPDTLNCLDPPHTI
ncbi:MAG: hypothetical protein AAGF54_12345 [Pseudomonadota bacterium]